MIKKEFTYDHNLYEIGRLKWYIIGINIHQKNSDEIKKVSKRFPHVLTLFPILNEYALTDNNNIQEHLHTDGDEIYYGDGTSYVGHYHIHPSKGPMEGATHTQEPHEALYYFNQLPEYPNASYQEFLENYDKIACYECKFIAETMSHQIVGFMGSRIVGCPDNSYETQIETSNNCPRQIN